MRETFRMALVAAARNEAAYLTDWVFHHLRYGFSPIRVVVNRSDDATLEIGRRIAARHDDVSVVDAGHPGPKANPQLMAYRAARRDWRRRLDRHDQMMCIDIDEFWTPDDFTSTIQDVLDAAGRPRRSAYAWYRDFSDTRPFAPPFSAEMAGRMHPMVKSAFRLDLPVLRLMQHGVDTLWPAPIWSASGEPMQRFRHHRTRDTPARTGRAFVVHRMFRSPVEYLAMLGRGRPAHEDRLFKDNRFGYHMGGIMDVPLLPFRPPAAGLGAYETARAEFYRDTGVADLVEAARLDVLARAARVRAQYLALTPEARKRWSHAFRGFDLHDLPELDGADVARRSGGNV